jgi:hypothetical protein
VLDLYDLAENVLDIVGSGLREDGFGVDRTYVSFGTAVLEPSVSSQLTTSLPEVHFVTDQGFQFPVYTMDVTWFGPHVFGVTDKNQPLSETIMSSSAKENYMAGNALVKAVRCAIGQNLIGSLCDAAELVQLSVIEQEAAVVGWTLTVRLRG